MFKVCSSRFCCGCFFQNVDIALESWTVDVAQLLEEKEELSKYFGIEETTFLEGRINSLLRQLEQLRNQVSLFRCTQGTFKGSNNHFEQYLMDHMPGVGLMVRGGGLGILAVELIPGEVDSACHPSKVCKMSKSMLVSCVRVATHPGLCPIAKETA